ncbi:MAG: tryptophan--tRNA ligase [bacterium]
MTTKDIVFSGIQPTGTLHIGNYFGALRQWIALQDQYTCFYSIVDLHALTVRQDPRTFAEQTLNAAMDFCALGFDPNKAVLCLQSQIPEHTELSWLLTTLTPIGELERMTQYKDKAREHSANVNAGLLLYPVLMAADILLYKGTLVPVGEDQVQHVELARVLARKFNNTYGQTFPEPKPKLNRAARIMSLTDPTKKMSKSHGEKSYIALTDAPSVIGQKLAKAVTATTGGRKNPGVENLFTIMREVSDAKTVARFEEQERGGTIKYADLKKRLAADLAEHFAPFRARRAERAKNPRSVLEILEEGRKRASALARRTMEEVQKKVGLLLP